MTEKFRLVQDSRWEEWRLLRHGAECVESIFCTLDDAIRKLPDAVGNVSAVVDVINSTGSSCGRHVIERVDRTPAKVNAY